MLVWHDERSRAKTSEIDMESNRFDAVFFLINIHSIAFLFLVKVKGQIQFHTVNIQLKQTTVQWNFENVSYFLLGSYGQQ